jgi:hypothetical protein
MQWYVDGFIKAGGADSKSRIAALDALAEAVAGQEWSTQFAGHILAYIAQQRDGLAGG